MKISTTIISDPSEILKIQKELDTFSNNFTNPFFLSPFIRFAMELHIPKGSTPVVLVIKNDEKIIGIAPLLLKQHLGIRSASFLLNYWLSPDFIIEAKYREIVLKHILNVVLKKMHCKFITLDLPAESTTLRDLERLCTPKKIAFRKKIEPYLNHRVIPVKCSWDDFEKLKGGKYRRRFKRIAKKLDKNGKWKITLFENSNFGHNACATHSKILEVEKQSWKEKWRLQNAQKVDKDLLWLLSASPLAAKNNPDFQLKVWLLEINNQPAAYSLIIQYKGTAFIAKTSYSNRYRRFYLGLHINNAVVKDLFTENKCCLIDFMTNLPFQEIWSSTCMPRVRCLIKGGAVTNFLDNTIRNSKIHLALNKAPFLGSLANLTR